ncbi:hypothetical protein EPUS_03313 [Endocarpon pusillum Z07020]|uniref:Uncharacterized protein n=1 Tax=Endocarpon pusillum (strain Z07020 / HMAS-L-300199) TaxID=1263415 RepID=U1GFY9_ENDPU|nr:uncharacterized protein EPUS_03313 [Endocarpon pusillum Z07020]ERF71033.1 hypothetical protein EPUS_03313 [Endocarpon pusillum Z07020]
MEVHAVLPEERARDEQGNILPWGYRYLDSSRNPRLPPEESGPFGKNRTTRYTGSRSSRTRTGTTPVRQKENPTVAEFGRLFAKEQKEEEERQSKNTLPSTSSGDVPKPLAPPEGVATECLIYGYASKASEWKVLSKYERIVAPSYICEDYPRDDPNLALTSSNVFSNSVVVHRKLTKDALRKSRVYKGGNHWIKVTFDTYQAAERACFYSPQEIEDHLVFCEMWQGRPPFSDTPLIKGSHPANEHQRNANAKLRTLTTSQTTSFLQPGVESAIAGFERATQTLPRSFTAQDVQYGQPQPPVTTRDDTSIPSPQSQSSTTASSATATAIDAPPSQPQQQLSSSLHPTSTLRSRSVPSLPTTLQTPHSPSSSSREYMTAIPTVRKAVLRPISEALLPQPTLTTRILRHIPILSWFVASSSKAIGGQDWIGDGPVLTEDGKWDEERNGCEFC